MFEFAGKTALVTGAASGIGRETARLLAKRGARLVICDVNQGALHAFAEELRGQEALLFAEVLDVSSRGCMQALADRVHSQVPALDILVNNAGVGLAGGFLETSLDDFDWVLSINLRGVIHGLHFFLPKMVARGTRAHVVNLASLAGYWVGSGLTGYLTSKFAVFGLSEAVREDLIVRGARHVGVSTVCPGIIHTGIIHASRIRMTGDAEAIRERLERAYKKRNYGPEKVAAAIVRAIEHNRKIVPVSPESWAMYHVNRLNVPLSRWIARATVKQMMG